MRPRKRISSSSSSSSLLWCCAHSAAHDLFCSHLSRSLCWAGGCGESNMSFWDSACKLISTGARKRFFLARSNIATRKEKTFFPDSPHVHSGTQFCNISEQKKKRKRKGEKKVVIKSPKGPKEARKKKEKKKEKKEKETTHVAKKKSLSFFFLFLRFVLFSVFPLSLFLFLLSSASVDMSRKKRKRKREKERDTSSFSSPLLFCGRSRRNRIWVTEEEQKKVGDKETGERTSPNLQLNWKEFKRRAQDIKNIAATKHKKLRWQISYLQGHLPSSSLFASHPLRRSPVTLGGRGRAPFLLCGLSGG